MEPPQPIRSPSPPSPLPDWGLDRIDQRALPLNSNYAAVGTGTNVHVYIMDSGVRASHLEFQGRVSRSTSFVSDGMGTNDCNGHGTHVAGTALGATMGVARNAILHTVRVMDRCGRGSTSSIVAGINWINANVQKPAVVNMSLGGGANPAIDAAVSSSISKGITYVIAAGNSALNACNTSPARVAAAITVGATDRTDNQAEFSNFGSCVDLYAPGVEIRSAGHTADGARELLDGTSMAAPHVAGAAALYLSRFPNSTPAQVAAALRSAATVGRISIFGAGSPNRLLFVGSGNQAATTCTDLARDGGFEAGGTQWTQSSARDFDLICTQTSCGQTIAPQSGARMAWLGGDQNETATLRQDIALPAGKNALLGFWYRTASADQCGFDRRNRQCRGRRQDAGRLELCAVHAGNYGRLAARRDQPGRRRGQDGAYPVWGTNGRFACQQLLGGQRVGRFGRELRGRGRGCGGPSLRL